MLLGSAYAKAGHVWGVVDIIKLFMPCHKIVIHDIIYQGIIANPVVLM